MRSLADDGPIIIKPAAKGCCVVLWDRENYLDEGYNQLSDTSTYVEVKTYNMNYYHNFQKRVISLLNDYTIVSLLVRRNLYIFHINLRIPVV